MPGRRAAQSPFDGIGAASPKQYLPSRLAQDSTQTPNLSNQKNQSRPEPVVSANNEIISSDTISQTSYFDVIVPAKATESDYHPLETWLGDVVVDQAGSLSSDHEAVGMPKSGSSSSINAIVASNASSCTKSASSAIPDPSRFLSRVQELIDTERSYVKRVNVLHQQYALPLRSLARHRDTTILSLYEAQRLFGNIGEVAGANSAFLNDLEALAKQGPEAIQNKLGDVLYQHMSCFSCYNEYLANFEKAKHIEQTMSKHKGFRDFTDNVKYSVTDIGNTGLRDLLMEPVQRIPRYKLLIEAILKHLDARDSQRPRFEQAIAIASRIASCEADEKTKRAAVLWSFSRNVDSFPPEFISVHRQFIDCIDVDDFPMDSLGLSTAYAASKPLHCTLFLFDDRIAVVKRAHATSSGRKLVGLEDLNQLAIQMKTFTEKSSSAVVLASSKKVELAFRGFVNIMDVQAQDLGGTDLQLALTRSPSLVSGDKWTSRPIRQYVTVDTTAMHFASNSSSSKVAPPTSNPDVSARLDKMRFLDNLWRARALYRARDHHSRVRCHVIPASVPRSTSDEYLAAFSEPTTASQVRRLVYYNIYTRPTYLAESNKSAVALHFNIDEQSDWLTLGSSVSAPLGAFEVISFNQHLGDCCVKSRIKRRNKQEVASELLSIPLVDIPHHLIKLSEDIDRSYGTAVQILAQSNPGTPTGSGFKQRAKAAAGLENFGRSLLFGNGGAGSSSTVSSAGISSLDIFGSPVRRSHSTASKSTYSSSLASISSRAMTSSSVHTSVSSKQSAFGAHTRNNKFVSPRSGARNRRRSSSVGAPTAEHYDCSSYIVATQASNQDHSSGMDFAEQDTKLVSELLLSSPPTSPSPEFDAERHRRAQSVELNRASSTASKRPTGPRQAMSPAMHAGNVTISWSSPVPSNKFQPTWQTVSSGGEERKDAATMMRSQLVSASGNETRPTSLSAKRALPLDPEAAENSFKRPSLDSGRFSGAEQNVADVQSLSSPASINKQSTPSSKTSTERDTSRGGSKAGVKSRMPTTPARTSSVASKTQESRRRNEAVDHCLRLVQEELKALRADAEMLRATGADLMTRTPRRRTVEQSVMHECDANTGEHVLNIGERVVKLEHLLSDLESRWTSSIRMQNRVMHDFNNAVPISDVPVSVTVKTAGLTSTSEVEALRTQVAALRRKCELLTTLEADGRIENTEIHKAFNEELDLMYENAQKPEVDELRILRDEVKRVKAEHHTLSVSVKSLKRDLEIQKSQNQVYEGILTKHGLL